MHRCMHKPILLALVAGSAAYRQEETSDENIVSRAIQKLRRVLLTLPHMSTLS